MYIENPKTKGSGIICAIPQRGECPNNCEDCFFQSGRSYLEPLESNLPNVPPFEKTLNRIVRVNDGNDSNIDRDIVEQIVAQFTHRFYNTAIPKNLDSFSAPVVLTVNPGSMTDSFWHKVNPIPKNLMFVRFRTNLWNLNLCDEVVDYYSKNETPIVLTFMAYFRKLVQNENYIWRKRTLNSYWAITTKGWRQVMQRYENNKWVYSCGKIEGELGDTHCRFCGNCLREYFATLERISK